MFSSVQFARNLWSQCRCPRCQLPAVFDRFCPSRHAAPPTSSCSRRAARRLLHPAARVRACSSILLMGSMSRSARAATSSPRSSTSFWSCLALACNETHRERSPSSTTTSCRFLAVRSSGCELELGPGCRVLVESQEVFISKSGGWGGAGGVRTYGCLYEVYAWTRYTMAKAFV